jgi:hypothetical protein
VVVSLDAFTYLDVALVGLSIDKRLGTISALEATLGKTTFFTVKLNPFGTGTFCQIKSYVITAAFSEKNEPHE